MKITVLKDSDDLVKRWLDIEEWYIVPYIAISNDFDSIYDKFFATNKKTGEMKSEFKTIEEAKNWIKERESNDGKKSNGK